MGDWKTSVRAFFRPGEQRRRLMMAVLGVVICAASVALFKQAAFGTDPFQSMCNGLNRVIPISFGTLYVLINAVLLVAVLVFDRHYLGVATLINLFLTGYIVDFCEGLLRRLAGEPSMVGRIVCLIAGIVLMCAASSLYFTADLGVSTYDFVALYLSKIQQKVPFRLVRILTDLVCVSVGFALGFAPGVGTLVTAFFMGPLISYFNVHLAEPMRSGRRLGGAKEKRT